MSNAKSEHDRVMKDYIRYYKKKQPAPEKTDWDVLKEEYRFIRQDNDNDDNVWSKRFAKQYYDKLYKNYCLANFSRFKEGKIGMRWRTEEEVIDGKGQFTCGAEDCTDTEGLRSYEVNFAYTEAGKQNRALVKLRVCPACAIKLGTTKQQAKVPPKKDSESVDTSKTTEQKSRGAKRTRSDEYQSRQVKQKKDNEKSKESDEARAQRLLEDLLQ